MWCQVCSNILGISACNFCGTNIGGFFSLISLQEVINAGKIKKLGNVLKNTLLFYNTLILNLSAYLKIYKFVQSTYTYDVREKNMTKYMAYF